MNVDTTTEIIYEFARASLLQGWWAWVLVFGLVAALLYGCVRLYRKDTDEVTVWVRWTLILLRLVAIIALVFFFFDLQRRTQRLVTRPSEVVVLVDTSQSMSLPAGSVDSKQSRSVRAAQLLDQSDLLQKLSDEHRVSVYAFGEEAEPRVLETRGSPLAENPDETLSTEAAFSPMALVGSLVVILALILCVASLLIGAAGRAEAIGPPLLTGAIAMIAGILCLGGIYAIRTEYKFPQLLGFELPQPEEADNEEGDESAEQEEKVKVSDWSLEIAASGAESRIGDAVRNVLSNHDPATLAGVLLVTDGQANGGRSSTEAMTMARRSEVAVYPIGMGSSDAPVNVRVVDLDAPRRVYPGDKFAVAGVLQASGPRDIEVDVQLLDTLDVEKAEPTKFQGEVIDSQKAKIASDGRLTDIRFELEPKSVGRRRLAIRVVSPEADRNKDDDIRDARYEVVSRKLRVLAIAGGPTREYRFARNLLYRDKSIELDVLLQSGQPGMSQDADRVLSSFPSTAEELFEYDAIIAFDPDWLALSAEQLEVVDRWLAQQAGGMVIVAGPVFHPRWNKVRTDPRVAKISGFFPVNFSSRGPLLGGGRQGGENAWPIKFTSESRRAEFLWIADDPADSFDTWERFGGVFDYVGVKSPKRGAKVYGYFSDPTTEIGDSLPVYLASQFYGAGRTYFQGSGEIWRLRGQSDVYFDGYYTKLIRWVSEGRLLRDSNRGVVMLDTTRAMVGDTITIRAVLTDDQFEPLDVPDVPAKVLAPGGRIFDLKLQRLKGEPRAGTYGGRFIVREAGSYEVRVTLGDALDEEVLRQSLQVRLPTIELERPRRNDAELEQFANLTGGKYFPMEEDSSVEQISQSVLGEIRPQPQTTILPGTPDQEFSQRRNVILMWLIATVLTMEWVTRRLQRLA